MIVDVHTPSMNLPANLPAGQKRTLLTRPTGWPSIRWLTARWPSVSGAIGPKALASISIIAITAGIVFIRAPEISQAKVMPSAAVEPVATASVSAAPVSADSECSNQVWPHIAANCLLGQTPLDAARIAVGTAQPDAQKQLQNATEQSKSEQSLRTEPEQSSRRETREERRARRSEERRTRYEEQRAQHEARYEERRARYEERRARRYQFAF